MLTFIAYTIALLVALLFFASILGGWGIAFVALALAAGAWGEWRKITPPSAR